MGALAVVAMICALVPAVLFVVNLGRYRVPEGSLNTRVSVLIPARDEAGAIGAAVEAVLRSVGAEFEVVVMDDGSSDGTDLIVEQMARKDARVRLERAPALPAGWKRKAACLLGACGNCSI